MHRSQIRCASSARRRQNAFACCATALRLIRYIYFGTYATLPGYEGDERDRAKVQSGSRRARCASWRRLRHIGQFPATAAILLSLTAFWKAA